MVSNGRFDLALPTKKWVQDVSAGNLAAAHKIERLRKAAGPGKLS